jgi:branched-chain amino acid transport system permease protein
VGKATVTTEAAAPSRVGLVLRSRWLGMAMLAVLLLLTVLMGMRSTALGTLSTATTIFMFIVMAQAWNILGGYAGYLNLGMAAFFGVGAYTSGVLSYHFGWSPFWTMFLAGAAAALFAAAVGYPSLRVRGPYFAILTLILTFVSGLLVMNLGFTRGALGIYLQPVALPPLDRSRLFYFLFLAMAVAAVATVYLIEKSKFGNALVTIREDEDAAEILGIRTTSVKMKALLLGAFMTGVVGGLFALRISYIEPTGTFAVIVSIDVLLMSVVGGMGTWQGPLIGVPVVMAIAESLRVGIVRLQGYGIDLPVEFNLLVLGLVLVFVALFARRGIMGLFQRARGRQQGV